MIQSFLEAYQNNLLFSIIITIIILFYFYRLYKTARIYLGIKSYVKKTKNLRKKKYNGIQLVDKIRKKRKKRTNSFNRLNRSGKKIVSKYFTYKTEELPAIKKYSYSNLVKRSNDKLLIIVKNDKKTIDKVNVKKGIKNIIELTNKYNCLDEMIHFLHNLPEALLEQQDYDIFIGEHDVSIGYDAN